MGARNATSEEERWIMAFHEAGHITITILSHYFDIKDPAVKIIMDDEFGAISEIKKIHDTTTPTAAIESTKEYVRIALGGRVSELMYSDVTAQTGAKVYPNPNGADGDIKSAKETLQLQNMDEQYDQLYSEAATIVCENWDTVTEIAEAIFNCKACCLSQSSIRTLESVKRHLT